MSYQIESWRVFPVIDGTPVLSEMNRKPVRAGKVYKLSPALLNDAQELGFYGTATLPQALYYGAYNSDSFVVAKILQRGKMYIERGMHYVLSTEIEVDQCVTVFDESFKKFFVEKIGIPVAVYDLYARHVLTHDPEKMNESEGFKSIVFAIAAYVEYIGRGN